MQEVTIYDSVFEQYLSEKQIDNAVSSVAENLNRDYQNQEVLFISVLNGSFMFSADLLKKIDLKCAVTFVKMQSYEGTSTTGKINELIGLNENLEGKNVVIIEDIVDTGNTLEKLSEIIAQKNVKSSKIATLLYKPTAYKKEFPIDYVGIEIPNDFVVGYGLDYDGLGRNLSKIYKLKKH